MRPDPTILAFDTSAAHCAAALLKGGTIRQQALEHLLRGQAERLMPMLESILADEGLGWPDLDAIGVGIGPGNFTGIRISVAAARGLALGLEIPAVGISSFELMLDEDDRRPGTDRLVSLEAPRGQAYVQLWRGGQPAGTARQISPLDPPDDLRLAEGGRVIGYMAGEIASRFGVEAAPAAPRDIGPRIAQAAARRIAAGQIGPERPAPLYVRGPDARPSREVPPPMLP